jgi:hypothetical protein
MALIEKLKNIANAIRSKTNKSEEMTLEQMASEIENIDSIEHHIEKLSGGLNLAINDGYLTNEEKNRIIDYFIRNDIKTNYNEWDAPYYIVNKANDFSVEGKYGVFVLRYPLPYTNPNKISADVMIYASITDSGNPSAFSSFCTYLLIKSDKYIIGDSLFIGNQFIKKIDGVIKSNKGTLSSMTAYSSIEELPAVTLVSGNYISSMTSFAIFNKSIKKIYGLPPINGVMTTSFLGAGALEYIDLDITTNYLYRTFAMCLKLKKIKTIKLNGALNATPFFQSFMSCFALEECLIAGYSIYNLSFSYSQNFTAESIKYIIWHAMNGNNNLGFENQGATSRTLQLHATPYASWETWKLTKPSVEDCEYLGIDETEITKYGELTWEDIALNVKLITVAK